MFVVLCQALLAAVACLVTQVLQRTMQKLSCALGILIPHSHVSISESCEMATLHAPQRRELSGSLDEADEGRGWLAAGASAAALASVVAVDFLAEDLGLACCL